MIVYLKACKNFYNDGSCHNFCPRLRIYNTQDRQWMDNPDGKYSYGALCVKDCPCEYLRIDTTLEMMSGALANSGKNRYVKHCKYAQPANHIRFCLLISPNNIICYDVAYLPTFFRCNVISDVPTNWLSICRL